MLCDCIFSEQYNRFSFLRPGAELGGAGGSFSTPQPKKKTKMTCFHLIIFIFLKNPIISPFGNENFRFQHAWSCISANVTVFNNVVSLKLQRDRNGFSPINNAPTNIFLGVLIGAFLFYPTAFILPRPQLASCSSLSLSSCQS